MHGATRELPFFSRARIADFLYSKAVENYSKGDMAASLCDLDMLLYSHPTYLEGIRLKERIVSQASTENGRAIERIMLEQIDRQEAPMWMRR
jgi:hypothetical protein